MCSTASITSCSGNRAEVVRQLPAFDPTEVQDVVDDAEQVLLAALDAPELLALRVGDRTRQLHHEQLRVATDGVERRAQLVRHRGEKLTLGAIRFVGAAARFLRFARPRLRAPAV